MTGQNNTRQRILIVGEPLTPSHLMRPWSIAEHLVKEKKKYEVHFAAPQACWPKDYLNSEVQMHNLDSVSQIIIQKRMRLLLPFYSSKEILKYLSDEKTLLLKIAPDIIIGDFRHTLSISSRLLSIPYVAMLDFYWSPQYKMPIVVPENTLVKIFGQAVFRFFAPFITPLVWKAHLSPYNRAAKHFGLPTYEDIRNLYVDATKVFYFDLPSIADLDPLPKNHYFVGPCIWEVASTVPNWLSPIKENSAIFITMASSGKASLVPKISQALLPLEKIQIIATANSFSLPMISKNVFSADYLPLSQVLPKCLCIVGHGGSSLVYLGLQHSLPTLGIPSNVAQWYSMLQFVKKGVGLNLAPAKATPTAIREAVLKLINDKNYVEKCKTYRAEIDKYNWKILIPEILQNMS